MTTILVYMLTCWCHWFCMNLVMNKNFGKNKILTWCIMFCFLTPVHTHTHTHTHTGSLVNCGAAQSQFDWQNANTVCPQSKNQQLQRLTEIKTRVMTERSVWTRLIMNRLVSDCLYFVKMCCVYSSGDKITETNVLCVLCVSSLLQ